jgi:hypothetical protein
MICKQFTRDRDTEMQKTLKLIDSYTLHIDYRQPRQGKQVVKVKGNEEEKKKKKKNWLASKLQLVVKCS